jgi:hypothetical protein
MMLTLGKTTFTAINSDGFFSHFATPSELNGIATTLNPLFILFYY